MKTLLSIVLLLASSVIFAGNLDIGHLTAIEQSVLTSSYATDGDLVLDLTTKLQSACEAANVGSDTQTNKCIIDAFKLLSM